MDEILCRELLENSEKEEIKKLTQEIRFDLPEKVLQFGTGGFLRGFTDYLIDKANKQNLFDGSVLVVKSTPGSAGHFARQDNLYTLNIRDKDVNEFIVSAPISRVVSANDQWTLLLEAAQNKDIQLVISNTTEAGLQFTEEDLSDGQAPASFPGKLTALLHQRYQALGGTAESGWVILPCELVVNNGNVLRDMVLKLAGHNGFGTDFVNWLSEHNRFCNTIVDRIIPGKPDPEQQQKTFTQLGYTDNLLLECESYLLWAIEGDQQVREALPFAKTDQRVIITDDIEPYREQKLRLLNGTHTISVPLAFLCGMETVYQAVHDPLVSRFMQQVMQDEIAPTLEGISPDPPSYAKEVFARFGNPHIEHRLLNIMFQQSTKMTLRNAATIQRYFDRYGTAPRHIALGFAAYLCYMRSPDPTVQDDQVTALSGLWNGNTPEAVVRKAIELLQLTPGEQQAEAFTASVTPFLKGLLDGNARNTLETFLNTTPATP